MRRRAAPCRPDLFAPSEAHCGPPTEAEKSLPLRLYSADWRPR